MNFDIQAPEKNHYKFNEVTSLTGVKPYVLRFWETEFAQIKPELSESGQKVYSQSDIDIIQKIKKLLFEDKLSIPEVRGILDSEPEPEEVLPMEEGEVINRSIDLKKALEDIIEKNSRPNSSEAPVIEDSVALSLADKIKEEVQVNNKRLADKDVVSLVSAKKKLTGLLGKIESLAQKHNW